MGLRVHLKSIGRGAANSIPPYAANNEEAISLIILTGMAFLLLPINSCFFDNLELPLSAVIRSPPIAVHHHNRQLRKVTKTKTVYPTDDALKKIIYLATVEAAKKWTMPVKDWKNCISQFAIYFMIGWKLSWPYKLVLRLTDGTP